MMSTPRIVLATSAFLLAAILTIVYAQNVSVQSVDHDDFARLERGMSYEQVVEILGFEGNPVSEAITDEGVRFVSYTWPGDGYGIAVMFGDNELYNKFRYNVEYIYGDG